MKQPVVILIGFSTAGKSHHSGIIREKYGDEFEYWDSDQFASADFDKHIFKIFLQLGRQKALKYIEEKEEKFLKELISSSDKPRLVAAGPFLVIRRSWEHFWQSQNVFSIHLDRKVENIYKGLLERRAKHKKDLDTNNANFGSWDVGVITDYTRGKYHDVPPFVAEPKVKSLVTDMNGYYKKFNHAVFDSDALRLNADLKNEFYNLMLAKLRNQ